MRLRRLSCEQQLYADSVIRRAVIGYPENQADSRILDER